MAMIVRAAPGYPPIPPNFPVLLSNQMRIIEPAFAYMIEQAELRAHSPETIRTYGEHLYDWFDTLEQSDLSWDKVDEGTILAYRNRMLEGPSPYTGRPFARSTINDRVRSVCRFYAWAHRRKMIDEPPVQLSGRTGGQNCVKGLPCTRSGQARAGKYADDRGI